MTRVMRVRGWLDRWKPIRPLLVAEVVALTGFAALLPVLPLYISEQGIDTGTVGLILAAWPLARLLCEPIFGYLADRTARRPFILAGVGLMAVFAVLPIVFTTVVALFALRFLYGVAVAMYEPAARGFLVDSTEEGERGEAFGLYSAASMLGLVLGPVIGTFGTSLFGGYGFVFLFSGLMHLASGAYLFVALPEHRLTPGAKRTALSSAAPQAPDSVGGPEPVGGSDSPGRAAGWAIEREHDWPPSGVSATRRPEPGEHVRDGSVDQAPLRDLLNPSFVGAVLMNFGFYFSVGVYEVIWSLYMRFLGASIAWIGFTFTLFGLPVLLIGPFAGRIVDRIGALPFAALGGLAIAGTGVAYTFATDPTQPVVFLLIEATGWAFSGPALFAILARGTPRGRSSTAQGFFGSSGTLAFVIASSVAGALFAMNPRYPFYFFVGVTLVATAVGVVLVALGGRIRDRAERRELPATG